MDILNTLDKNSLNKGAMNDFCNLISNFESKNKRLKHF